MPTASRKIDKRVYYHGGNPGRQPGDLILSKSDHLKKKGHAHGYGGRPAIERYDSNAVYMTTNRELALAYAGSMTHQNTGKLAPGTLYQVIPLGPVQVDPDYDLPERVSFITAKAKVSAVLQTNVVTSHREQTRIFGAYWRWEDGGHYFSEDGAVLPGPDLRAAGWTNGAVALIPSWTHTDYLTEELSNLILDRPDEVLRLAPRLLIAENDVPNVKRGITLAASRVLSERRQFTAKRLNESSLALSAIEDSEAKPRHGFVSHFLPPWGKKR